MFVVSAMGYLLGPFETANDAAAFGNQLQESGPWSIIKIKEATAHWRQLTAEERRGEQ